MNMIDISVFHSTEVAHNAHESRFHFYTSHLQYDQHGHTTGPLKSCDSYSSTPNKVFISNSVVPYHHCRALC